MVRVVWAQLALRDLHEVFEFIARDSSHYARLTVERITDAAETLARFPQLGQIVPEYPEHSYRQLVVGSYRVIYREDPENQRVNIVAVVHAARTLPPDIENH